MVLGNIYISNGKIVGALAGNTNPSVHNASTGYIEISGNVEITNDHTAAVSNVNGTVTIKGGTVRGTYAINHSNGTLNIGDPEAELSDSNPVIYGTGNYGIGVTEATWNFYNGIIKAKQTRYQKDPTEVRAGCEVKFGTETINGVEYKTAYLGGKQYTVTFNATGGTVDPTTKPATYNELYGELPTPTREGYEFKGWFTEAEAGEQVTAETKVTQTDNHTLFAHWQANTYEVTFNAGDGVTVDPTKKDVTYDSPYGDLPTPEKTGYTFNSWTTGENLFNPQEFYEVGKNYGVHINENDITLNQYPYQENVTKTPVNCKENTQYILSYDWTVTNCDSNHLETGLQFVYTDGTRGIYTGSGTLNNGQRFRGSMGDAGHVIVTSDPNKTVEYISSSGWQYGSAARLSNIKLAEKITSDTIVKTASNHTLYANWEPNRYNVTFDATGGTVNPSTKRVAYSSKYGALPTPTRDGYSFKGWRGKNMFNLKGRTIKDGGEYSNETKRNFTGDGIYVGLSYNNYYLPRTVSNYNIDENNNSVTVTSGSGYGIGFDVKVLNNTTYTLSFNNDSTVHTFRFGEYKQDGTLINWNSSNRGDEKSVTFTTNNETYWLAIIIASDNETTQSSFNIQLEQNNSATEFEPYSITTAETTVTKTSDHTLYAEWQANTYTIAYTLDGGTAGAKAPATGTYNENVEISNPTKDGYTFLGWTYTNGTTDTAMYGTTATSVTNSWSDGTTKVKTKFFKNLRSTAGTVTLTANWMANNYQNTRTLVGYETLALAIAGSTDGDTIKVLQDVEDTSTATFNKNLTLDLQTYTITRSATITVNSGYTLTLTGIGTLTASTVNTITNSGTFIKLGTGTLSNTATASYYAISNTGTATISAGTVSGGYRAIRNETNGILTISGATVTSADSTIYNTGTANTTSSPSVKVTSGTVQSSGNTSSKYAIYNNSTGMIYVTGGTVEQTGLGSAIYNYSTGKITVSAGTISSTSSYGISNRVGGMIDVSGGTVSGTNGVYNNTGTVLMSGSTTSITGTTYGLYMTTGTAEITDGTISATGGVGAYATSGTITLGTNDGTITSSTTAKPSITGTTYGVQVTTGTLNFYDGVVKGAYGQSIYPTTTTVNTPTGYCVRKITSGSQEIATIALPDTLRSTSNEDNYNSDFLHGTLKRKEIEKVTFVDTGISGHSTADSNCWDVSSRGEESILAWYTDSDSDDYYEVTIGSSYGIVKANTNSSYLLTFIGDNGDDTTCIAGINNLDVSDVTNMSYMFNYCGRSAMTSLDLGDKFDTNQVTNMSYMFNYCGRSAMTSLDLGDKFDTSQVTNMSYMFNYCGESAMTSLDLGDKFDTSQVMNMSYEMLACDWSSDVCSSDLIQQPSCRRICPSERWYQQQR